MTKEYSIIENARENRIPHKQFEETLFKTVAAILMKDGIEKNIVEYGFTDGKNEFKLTCILEEIKNDQTN